MRTALLILLAFSAATVQAHTVDAWLVSADATSPWRKINDSGIALEDLAFADVDGNGRTDIFRANGSAWFISRDGVTPWTQINTSSIRVPDLRFGDFNGNGRADVLRVAGGKWRVSFDGTGPWTEINTSNVSLSQLRLGDFNGNGRTDILRVADGKWRVSFDGVGQWQQINTSAVSLSELRFADFNGNGRTDVLRVADGKWRVSFDGVGQWTQINTSSVPLGQLGIADFDGNGRADIFRADGSQWFVSFDGVGQWQAVNTSSSGIAHLRFGDFDGNGRSDIFRIADQRHVALSVRRFITATISNANADAITAAASGILETNDGPGDRACLVHFVRAGTVQTFDFGDGSVDDGIEESTLHALVGGDVKVINAINFCGDRLGVFAGCATSFPNSILVVRTAANEGVLWAHEYGHARGLEHRNNTNAVMFPTLGPTRRRVDAAECAAYQ